MRTRDTGVCSFSDTVFIPLKTQRHSCFSKYPEWKPPPPHHSLLLMSTLPLLFLCGHSLHIRHCAFKCRICTMMLKSLSRTHCEFFFLWKLAEKLIGIHTYGRNGWAWMKKKSGHKPCTLCFNLSSSALGHFFGWSACVFATHIFAP